MSQKIAISVENVSKLYRLGEVGTGSFAHDVNRWWAKFRGKEDPYMKIAEVNDRSQKGTSDYVWALKDINFTVAQGEVLGIIGHNGAGKSTLLKILSRTTTPSTGRIKLKGRVASLLEVGIGFHPDLSGRDNIYLNGSILGMHKAEIKRKFDEIVAFAGIERYIDTPVKRYSSGMYVRLAFAVSAFLESEVFIVDEVLAVGDQDFQKKCLGKMDEVAKKDGRTVLFVSHDMNAIVNLTNKAILMKKGMIAYHGDTRTAVDLYLANEAQERGVYRREISGSASKPELEYAEVITSNMNYNHIFGEPLQVKMNVFLPFDIAGLSISFQIIDSQQKKVIYAWHDDAESGTIRMSGKHEFTCVMPKLRLYKGKYSLQIHLGETKGRTYFGSYDNICEFDVEIIGLNNEWGWQANSCAYIEDFTWKYKEE